MVICFKKMVVPSDSTLFFSSRVVHISSHGLQYPGRTVLVSLLAEPKRLVEPMSSPPKIVSNQDRDWKIKEPGPFRQGFVYKLLAGSKRAVNQLISSVKVQRGLSINNPHL